MPLQKSLQALILIIQALVEAVVQALQTVLQKTSASLEPLELPQLLVPQLTPIMRAIMNASFQERLSAPHTALLTQPEINAPILRGAEVNLMSIRPVNPAPSS